jgi:hypothetical protein
VVEALEKTPNVNSISINGIETTYESLTELKGAIIEEAPEWLGEDKLVVGESMDILVSLGKEDESR